MDRDIIIGIIFFVLGLIPTYYFYIKSIRIKQLVWAIRTVEVFSDYQSLFPHLNVTYKRSKVRNLSVSKILLYNKGEDAITHEDIQTINPLRIEAKKGVKILDASIMQINNHSSNISLDLQNNLAFIKFDYLNNSQGVVLSVLHTGLEEPDVYVAGDIKNVGKLIKQPSVSSFQRFYNTIPLFTKPAILIYQLFLVFVAIANYFSIIGLDDSGSQISNQPWQASMYAAGAHVFLAIFIAIDYFLYTIYRERISGISAVPLGLEEFNKYLPQEKH